jgi:DNA-binding NarL/FixJ family response regulator
MGFYQRAELHRLRGELANAENAYQLAGRWGQEPQPGLALLRLAQGHVHAAATAIRRVADEANLPVARARVLPAFVEIMLAAHDLLAARAAAGELALIADELGAPFLHAASDHATGAVLLAGGDARAALVVLRQAWAAWRTLHAPFEVAQSQALIGRACWELGDRDAAAMEFDAARSAFRRLGAVPSLARAHALSTNERTESPMGLTRRELEVLALVARGSTNREIAGALVISEHTVARHVQNILAKVGVSSRTAASAIAFEHDLV